jgi:hypothetical protein
LLSSSCFLSTMQKLRASSGCATPNCFFIGFYGQELSIPRNSTLTRMLQRAHQVTT